MACIFSQILNLMLICIYMTRAHNLQTFSLQAFGASSLIPKRIRFPQASTVMPLTPATICPELMVINLNTCQCLFKHCCFKFNKLEGLPGFAWDPRSAPGPTGRLLIWFLDNFKTENNKWNCYFPIAKLAFNAKLLKCNVDLFLTRKWSCT